MLWQGTIWLVVGLLYTLFKGRVVWDIAHDLFNGGGAPTLDFPVFCPVPLSMGVSLILISLGRYPFEGFGFVLYVCLATLFGLLLWLFNRIGDPERQRQLGMAKQKNLDDRDVEAQHQVR